MKIVIASDHRGFLKKEYIKKELQKQKYDILDLGTNSSSSCDYPDYAFKVGEAVAKKQADFGLLFCGSGIGMSIACNKVIGIRCAHVTTEQEAKLTRIDNNANVLALGETLPEEVTKKIILTFLTTPYESIPRFEQRIKKIKAYEERKGPYV